MSGLELEVELVDLLLERSDLLLDLSGVLGLEGLKSSCVCSLDLLDGSVGGGAQRLEVNTVSGSSFFL